MSDQCYAMVRGKGIRLTSLDKRGAYDSRAVKYATSKSVVKIEINEVTEGGSNEVLRTDDDEPRFHFVRSDAQVRFEADLSFLRCDPEILNLMTNVPMAYNASGDIVGFDSTTRLPAASFGLEVWSKVVGPNITCVADAISAGFGEANFGEADFGDGMDLMNRKPYGYTLFPHLRGGIIGGFEFSNGLVSFNIKGARTIRGSKWGYGPYDLEGPYMRLLKPVSRNTSWRTFLTTCPPPDPWDGTDIDIDIIDGNVGPDILDGNVGPYVLNGN